MCSVGSHKSRSDKKTENKIISLRVQTVLGYAHNYVCVSLWNHEKNLVGMIIENKKKQKKDKLIVLAAESAYNLQNTQFGPSMLQFLRSKQTLKMSLLVNVINYTLML